MTIATGDVITKWDSLATVSAVATSLIANGAYSVSGDVATGGWTNTVDAPQGSFVLTMQYPSGTITTGGIQLLCRLLNVDGTGDEPPLSANWLGHYLGNFKTGTGMSALTNYSLELGPVNLPAIKASQEYEFYLSNQCGVTITALWTLKIAAGTVGAKP